MMMMFPSEHGRTCMSSSRINLPHTDDMLRIARRVVWFEEPRRALGDPLRFLCHVMQYGRPEDVLPVLALVGQEGFRQALEQAPPGILDARSWNYWHLVLGHDPAPPMPTHPAHAAARP